MNNGETGIDCGGSCDPCGTDNGGGSGSSLWTDSAEGIYQNDKNIGVGTSTPESKLAVVGNVGIEGNVRAIEYTATPDIWPDYVFQDSYELPSIKEVEKFIKVNKHLPNVPSEAEIKKSGNNLGATDVILLEKIEELTLYIIELNNRVEELEQKLDKEEKK